VHEISILKSFLNKDTYKKYRNYLQISDLTKDLKPILEAIDYYWKNYTEEPNIQDIENIVVTIDKKSVELVKRLLEPLGEATIDYRLENLRRQRLYEELAVRAVEASEGGSHEKVNEIWKQINQVKVTTNFVTDDIIQILTQQVKQRGLRWRLKSLNQSLGSLRKGDFGFIFGRPETGKTTFLASEVSNMAMQIPGLTNTQSGPVLWLNNEEQGQKVKLRLVQAVLRKTVAQLISNPIKAQEEYLAKIGYCIKLYDSATISRREVENICEELNPSLIVIDKLDKITGFEEDRTDLELGAKFQWARELSKDYAPTIGSCQADGTAEGAQWLTMGHVANAKTAKQAEADFIIGIGKNTASGFEFMRYLNICKNKLIGDEDTDPAYRHAQITCMIRPEIALYEDL